MREEVSTPLLQGGGARLFYQEAVREIFLGMLPIAASYTFSFSIPVIAILAGHIDSNDDGKNEEYLSATTLITSVYYPTVTIALSVIFGALLWVLPKIGEYNNAETMPSRKSVLHQEIARLVKNIFLVSMTLPLLASIFIFFFSKSLIMFLFSQNEHDAELATEYLQIAAWTIPMLAMHLGFEKIMFPFNKKWQVAGLALSTFSIGIILAALFCYTLDLKLRGIAWGLFIEACLAMLVFAGALRLDTDLQPFEFFHVGWYDAEDIKQVKEIIILGLSVTLSMSSEVVSFFFINMFSGWVSNDALVAENFASQVFYFVFIPSYAIGEMTLISAGKSTQVREQVIYAQAGLMTVVVALGLIFVAPLLIYPSLMRYLITGNAVSEHIIDVSSSAVRIAAVDVFLMAISNMLLQTLRAFDPRNFGPTYIASGAAFLGAALAYVLGLQASHSLEGILGGFGMGIAVGTISLFTLWLKKINTNALGRQQNHVEIEGERSQSCLERVLSLCKLSTYQPPDPEASRLLSTPHEDEDPKKPTAIV